MHEGLILGAQTPLHRIFEQEPDFSLLNSELEFGSSRVQGFYSDDDLIQQISCLIHTRLKTFRFNAVCLDFSLNFVLISRTGICPQDLSPITAMLSFHH